MGWTGQDYGLVPVSKNSPPDSVIRQQKWVIMTWGRLSGEEGGCGWPPTTGNKFTEEISDLLPLVSAHLLLISPLTTSHLLKFSTFSQLPLPRWLWSASRFDNHNLIIITKSTDYYSTKIYVGQLNTWWQCTNTVLIIKIKRIAKNRTKIDIYNLCGRLSWLPISFSLHVKYTLSYHIVS